LIDSATDPVTARLALEDLVPDDHFGRDEPEPIICTAALGQEPLDHAREDDVVFPSHGILWGFDYRGPIDFWRYLVRSETVDELGRSAARLR
jgi:hypothetical protein